MAQPEREYEADMKQYKREFRQEMHCCGPDDGMGMSLARDSDLTIRIEDGGGGEYVVLNAFEWVFESDADIDELAGHLKQMLAACVDDGAPE